MPAARDASPSYVALLRGVNVGGKNKLPMPALAALFVEAGCSDVSTYIQSGNVLFSANAKTAADVAHRVHALVFERFGFRSIVVTRSAREIADVMHGNPFLGGDADPKHLHVMFLADAPTSAAVASLDPERSPGDEFAARGREIYLRLPHGVADSKLTNAYFDAKLATTSTSRNWTTVGKLASLLGIGSGG